MRCVALVLCSAACAAALAACTPAPPATPASTRASSAAYPVAPAFVEHASAKAHRFAEAAESQVGRTVTYDASYVALAYPGGDVPIERGVCTDVVIRAARHLGVDLQVEVHEDMSRAFARYPQKWGLPGPDANIDHRRVPNLQTYYTRARKALPVSQKAEEYWPGDVVTWDVWGRPHVGVVSSRLSADGTRYLIAHNIGSGTRITDDLFTFRVTGHYRPF